MRHALGSIAFALGLSAGLAMPAHATDTSLTFDALTVGGSVTFSGNVPGTTVAQDQIQPGLGTLLTLTLDSIEGYDWTFSYSLTNLSQVASAITSVGFQITAEGPGTSVAGSSANAGNQITPGPVSGALSAAGKGSLGGQLLPTDFCLTNGPGTNCATGSGGVTTRGTGTFTLEFPTTLRVRVVCDQQCQAAGGRNHSEDRPISAPTSITLSGFGVTYGGLPSSMGGSTTFGLPGTPVLLPDSSVPEPAAWTMMLLGLFGIGGVLRRQIAPAAKAGAK